MFKKGHPVKFKVGDTVFFKRTNQNLFVVKISLEPGGYMIYVCMAYKKNSNYRRYGISSSTRNLIRKKNILIEKSSIIFI